MLLLHLHHCGRIYRLIWLTILASTSRIQRVVCRLHKSSRTTWSRHSSWLQEQGHFTRLEKVHLEISKWQMYTSITQQRRRLLVELSLTLPREDQHRHHTETHWILLQWATMELDHKTWRRCSEIKSYRHRAHLQQDLQADLKDRYQQNHRLKSLQHLESARSQPLLLWLVRNQVLTATTTRSREGHHSI